MWPEPFDCPREPVVIGLSGGRDSVALLRMLAMRGVPMQACHVHHGIRGEAADGDAQFCRELCRQFDVPFAEYRVDVPAKAKQSGESLETTARRERRRILVEHALSVGFRAVALAHHADDQAETVLFNLARGAAGLRGSAAAGGRHHLAASHARHATNGDYRVASGDRPKLAGGCLKCRSRRGRSKWVASTCAAGAS